MTAVISHSFTDIWDYVRFLKLELAKEVESKTSIFFDLNYWIELRNAKNEESQNPIFYELLAKASTAVEAGKCVFPLTDSMLWEVLKQDGQRLAETIALIDNLSKGICIEQAKERIHFELLDFLRKDSESEKYTAREHLYTKFYFTFHNKLPTQEHDIFEKENYFHFLITLVDNFWNMKFGDILKFEDIDLLAGIEYPDHSDQLNNGKQQHTHEYSNFHELFMNEMEGWLDNAHSDIQSTYSYFYQSRTGEYDPNLDCQLCKNLIYHTFRLDKASRYLPHVRIGASCHAALRWEPSIKFDKNHQFDIDHASCALPYCDYFFTERQLKHLITQPLLHLDKLFGCTVVSRPQDACNLLDEILS
jgi:hypothetical protein